jgi:hypothetical protein
LSGSDQIPAELIQEAREILLLVIHNFVNPIWNKEAQWKESIIAPIKKKWL